MARGRDSARQPVARFAQRVRRDGLLNAAALSPRVASLLTAPGSFGSPLTPARNPPVLGAQTSP